jgi:uncharacterized protein (TIGR02145 family)
MKKKVNRGRGILKVALFLSAFLLTVWAFQSCQKDEFLVQSEEFEVQSGVISEIFLAFPQDVAAAEDFTITFSSACGRIMIERGFIEEVNVETGETIKIYSGLDCDNLNLSWEYVESNDFLSCQGGTISQNIIEPGTYVYRAKLNFKAVRGSECSDCVGFNGTKFQCFMINVSETSGGEFICGVSTITDYNGNVYNTVQIGEQCWIKENLRATIYNDGQPITDLQDAALWPVATEGGYAWYHNFSTEQKTTYGALYNWYAVETGKLCPAGWHVPSDNDWKIMEMSIGMSQEQANAIANRGTDEGDKMKVPGYVQWKEGNTGNNISGFTALGAGTRQAGGLFNAYLWHTAYWTSSTYVNPDYPDMVYIWNRLLFYNSTQVARNQTYSPSAGYSVRCVKD